MSEGEAEAESGAIRSSSIPYPQYEILNSHFIEIFKYFYDKIVLSKIVFFTLRCGRNSYSMDKVRKWLSRFSDLYIIVQSPKAGIHYHGCFVPLKKVAQLNRGVHFTSHSLGSQQEKLLNEPCEPMGHPAHPLIPHYSVGSQLLLVCEEIRRTMSLKNETPYKPIDMIKRVQGRRSRRRAKDKKAFHLNSVKDYLIKNFEENKVPAYYDHLIITMSVYAN